MCHRGLLCGHTHTPIALFLEDLRTLTDYSYVYCTRTAGPVVVGFDEPGLIVGEESGTLFILVSVNQQIDSDVTVNVAVIEGSATEREG